MFDYGLILSKNEKSPTLRHMSKNPKYCALYVPLIVAVPLKCGRTAQYKRHFLFILNFLFNSIQFLQFLVITDREKQAPFIILQKMWNPCRRAVPTLAQRVDMINIQHYGIN